jgi:hypothetical protein
MKEALDYLREHGVIVRYIGGFWARPGWRRFEQPWFKYHTIEALVRRGLVEYSEWKTWCNRRIPVAVKEIVHERSEDERV